MADAGRRATDCELDGGARRGTVRAGMGSAFHGRPATATVQDPIDTITNLRNGIDYFTRTFAPLPWRHETAASTRTNSTNCGDSSAKSANAFPK